MATLAVRLRNAALSLAAAVREHPARCAAALFVLGANVFVAWFVALEQTVYCWDYRAYHDATRALAGLLAASPAKALAEVARSLREDDYNLLPSVLLAPVLAAFGDSRPVFVLGVLNVYGVPAVLLLAHAARRLGGSAVATLVVLAVSPQLFAPIVRGYPDVGGVGLAALVLWLYLGAPRPLPVRTALGLGALLALLFLFRRYFAHWVVAFGAIATVDTVVGTLRAGALRRALVALALIAVAAAAAVCALAWPLVQRVLTTDFADAYAAYRPAAGLELVRATILDGAGILYALAPVAAAVVLLARRATRRIAGVLFGQCAAATLLFASVQGFGPHHYYVVLPGAVLLVGLAARAARPALASAALAAFALAGGLAQVTTFARAAAPLHAALVPLVPARRTAPMVRTDLAELRALLASVERTLAAAGPDARLYVLGSSETLSDELFRGARHEPGLGFVGRVLPTAHVDRRDGFPANLLRADLVCLGLPAQTHLAVREQTVVAAPALCFERGLAIASAFRRLPETFTLQGGVEVSLWERVRAPRPEEVRELSEFLRQAHPERPFVFEPR
jgi:hypothetical protein